MTNILDLPTGQLHRIIAIKEEIEKLQGELASIAGGDGEASSPLAVKAPRKRRMSAASRAKIAAGARARWARMRGESTPTVAKKGKRRLSAAGRAAIIAATKARWAKVKGTSTAPKIAKKKDGRSSPEVRARIAAAARARWAKVKAAGKTAL